jgi:hypothetical protein
MTGPSVIVFDNLTGKLQSSSLSAALTQPVWKDRVLGASVTGEWPIRCAWVATANNLQVSTDIARRTVRVRLDAKLDRPWEGRTFTHELPLWAFEHRAELVWAALCVGRAWLDRGKPNGERTLGSFSSWAKAMGGLLEVAGVGFLGNLAELYEQADADLAANQWLVESWWESKGGAWVKSSDLFTLTSQPDFALELGRGDEQSRRLQLGLHLAKLKDKHFTLEDGRPVRVERSPTKSQKVYKWRLASGGDQQELGL